MNLEQMKARLAEILANLQKFEELTNLSDEQVGEFEAQSKEFEDLKKNIEVKEKLAAMSASAQSSKRQVAPTPRVEVGEPVASRDPKHGWKHSGEFFKAVMTASTGGTRDARLDIKATHYEKSMEDGAILIPTDFRKEIAAKVMGDESLLQKTTLIQTASNSIELPVDEVAPWDSTAGLQSYWESEGGQLDSSKISLGSQSIKLNKLTALVKVTDELLEDAPALETYIKAKAPASMLHKINSAIISGDGAGKPLGILNAGFKFEVPKEAGQTAATVRFENIVKMMSHLLPGSLKNAAWFINPAVEEQLRLMKFDIGAASPVPVYIPNNNIAGQGFSTLMGLPIVKMMGGSKQLGSSGDIILADLSYYMAAVKGSGIKSDMSIHTYFDRGISCFRFIYRVGGTCLYKSPVTTENGNYKLSGIVTLAERA